MLRAGESPSNYVFISKVQNYLLTQVTFSANFDPAAKMIDVIMVEQESKEAKAAKPLEAGQFASGHEDTHTSIPGSPPVGSHSPGGAPLSPLAGATNAFELTPEQKAEQKAKRDKELRNQILQDAVRAEKEANEKAERERAEKEAAAKKERERIHKEREEAERIPDVPVPKDPFAARVQKIRLHAARDKRVAAFNASLATSGTGGRRPSVCDCDLFLFASSPHFWCSL